MSKAILVANWKNFPKSKEETARLLSQLARQGAIYKKRAVYIAPPFTYFESVASKVSSFASLATQDVPLPPDGVHTGEITADILRSFGTKLAILGHSERRAMGESNQVMAGKVRLAIRSGFKALVCVGEEVRDQDGQYFEFLKEQIKASLAGCKKLEAQKSLIVAYEPVWAIGDKALGSIKPEDLAQTVIFIKKIFYSR